MASAVVHRVQVRPGHQVHPVLPVPDPQAHPAPHVQARPGHQVHRVPPVPDRQVLQVRAHPAPHVHQVQSLALQALISALLAATPVR